MKPFFSIALAVCGFAAYGQNLLLNGDFSKSNARIWPECVTNGGKGSLYTEDLTWNKCGKLEIDKVTKDKDGNERISCGIWIGGDGKSGGFSAKPNTTYQFSIEIRGTATKVGISAMEWSGDNMWNDMRILKTTVGGITVQKDWVTYRGTFKTGPKAKRAALYLSLWENSKYAPLKMKVGDYILFDNVKIEEETNRMNASAPAKLEIMTKTVKAAKSALCTAAPKIDGTLNDAAWKNAPEINDFTTFKKNGAVTASTSVKILSDRENLYLGITCSEPLAINDSIKENGSKIWNGDLLELFFGAKSNDRILSQFVVGAGGGRFAGRGGAELNNGQKWEAKTSKNTGVWYAEIKIPFAELGWNNPVAGDDIAFNICRQRTNAKELSTWSPLKNSFHETAGFGILVLNDYAAALKRKYGIANGKTDRAGFEKQMAEAETALLKAQYERNAKRKFAVAPVSVTADFAIPFIPKEIFDPVEKIELKTAVNEMRGLPLAIANLTDKIAEYRVILEAGSTVNGSFGLKGFPEKQITFRKAVRFKDSDKDKGSLRLDPLPKMDQACTVTIPPKEAGLVWFDFDTSDVKPGTYEGRIRVLPLSEPASWTSINGAFHNRKYEGEMLDIPVSLTVRNIELSKEPAIPMGFFQNAENESMFRLMTEAGTRDFGLTPHSFQFELDKNGNINPKALKKHAKDLLLKIRQHQEWSKKYGYPQITFFIGFSSCRVFQSLYNTGSDPVKNTKLWPQWISAVKHLMNEAGVSDEYYRIETWDEPASSKFQEVLESHLSAKKAAPTVKLLLTLGAHILSAAEMEKLSPVTDAWVLWSYGYFDRPEHLALLNKVRAEGKTVQHYTCATSMRASLDRNYRRNAWFGEHNQLDGNMMFWFSDCYGGNGASDWKVATEGGLVYRSFDEFMPSLRYMALRQGMNDVKYLAKLRAVGKNSPEAGKFLKNAAKRVVVDFGHDPAIPDKVREEAAELILKLQR